MTSPDPISPASLEKLATALELIGPCDAAALPSTEAIEEAKELVASVIVTETGASSYEDELLSILAGRSRSHLCVALWMAKIYSHAKDLDSLAHVLSKVADGLLKELQKPENEVRSKDDQNWLTVAFTLVSARLVRCHCFRYKSGGAFQALDVVTDALKTVNTLESSKKSKDGIDALALLLLRYTEALQLTVSLQVVSGREVGGDIHGYVAERAHNFAILMCYLKLPLVLDGDTEPVEPAPVLPEVLDKTFPRPGLTFAAIHAETFKNAGKAYAFLLDHVESTGEEIDVDELELETDVSVDGVAGLFDSAVSCAREEPENRDCRTTAAVALYHLVTLYTKAGRGEDAAKSRAELVALLNEGNLDESQIDMGAIEMARAPALGEGGEPAAPAA